MAKVTFASLKLKTRDDVEKINLYDKEIQVKQYLRAEDNYDFFTASKGKWIL